MKRNLLNLKKPVSHSGYRTSVLLEFQIPSRHSRLWKNHQKKYMKAGEIMKNLEFIPYFCISREIMEIISL